MPSNREHLILGGGIIGCSIALELARRGESVTVVERHGEVGHGTTSASCAIVRCFYSTDTMTALAHEGASIWSAWREHLQPTQDEELARFLRCGMLFIQTTETSVVQETIARMQRHGVEVQWLDATQLRARFPYLDVASQFPVRSPDADDFFEPTGRQIAGAVHELKAGYVISPALATRNIRDAAARAGARFHLGDEVLAIEGSTGLGDTGVANGLVSDRFRLRMQSGKTLHGDVLVNAAGPHSSLVNRMAAVDLGIETRPLRREVHALSNPAHERPGVAPVPIVADIDSGLYFQPEAGGIDLLLGSLDPQGDVMEWLEDPDENDVQSSVACHERHLLRLMKRFPEVQFERKRGLGSMYDVTTLDWNPVLDRTDRPGYYVAIGTSGSSFKTAPVIGKLMTELITQVEAGHDHDQHPLQMRLEQTGIEIDLGFFSRLRGAHNSSNTVLG